MGRLNCQVGRVTELYSWAVPTTSMSQLHWVPAPSGMLHDAWVSFTSVHEAEAVLFRFAREIAVALNWCASEAVMPPSSLASLRAVGPKPRPMSHTWTPPDVGASTSTRSAARVAYWSKSAPWALMEPAGAMARPEAPPRSMNPTSTMSLASVSDTWTMEVRLRPPASRTPTARLYTVRSSKSSMALCASLSSTTLSTMMRPVVASTRKAPLAPSSSVRKKLSTPQLPSSSSDAVICATMVLRPAASERDTVAGALNTGGSFTSMTVMVTVAVSNRMVESVTFTPREKEAVASWFITAPLATVTTPVLSSSAKEAAAAGSVQV
mmetsp:Transcript_18135/g.68547  ORF Transcript_18135/g.68547 Transcript_18135/m.68547 type:complete len:323 (-) Transcript_18135:7397-8365(-)